MHTEPPWTDTEPGADLPPQAGAFVLSPARLHDAVGAGLINAAQAQALWQFWTAGVLQPVPASSPPSGPRFGFTQVLYYFGGLIAIGAMTLFMTLGWNAWGPLGTLLLTLAYLVGCLKVTQSLLQRQLPMAASQLATLAVCLVPLAVWCLQHLMGWWPEGGSGDRYYTFHTRIDWRWLMMELATLAAGVVLLWRIRLPFMVMPLAVTLWYMSMDVAHGLMQQHGFDWKLARDISLVFGLGTCALAVWVDVRCRRARVADFAFWLYLFGAVMAWGGLSLRDSSSELGKLVYALVNVGWVLGGAAIGRRVFTVLGGLGVTIYLGHLAHTVFRDSLLFPFALSVLGLGVVALGIWWQRHEAQLQARLQGWVPEALREVLPLGKTRV